MADQDALKYDPNAMNSILSRVLTRMDEWEKRRDEMHAENLKSLKDLREDVDGLKKYRWMSWGVVCLAVMECGWLIALKAGGR